MPYHIDGMAGEQLSNRWLPPLKVVEGTATLCIPDVYTRHQNGYQTYNIKNGGRLSSEKETYLWRTHSIIGISQKRY